MKRSTRTSLLKRVHSSTEKLQRAIDIHSYLLTSSFDPPDSNNHSKPLAKLTQTLSSTFSDVSNQSLAVQLDRTTSLEKNQSTPQQTAEPYHELMRKQSRRLHYSWPPRQVDAFEDDSSVGSDILPRMKALESTAALSLATFTSLLIEFVARLDHLVEAVDVLSKLAKF